MWFDAPPWSAPVVSSRNAVANAAWTEASKVFTVAGLNFLSTDYTASARLSTAECSTLSWISSSSAYCQGALASPLVATIGGVVGTRSFSFTYDGKHTAARHVFVSWSEKTAFCSACGQLFGELQHATELWRCVECQRGELCRQQPNAISRCGGECLQHGVMVFADVRSVQHRRRQQRWACSGCWCDGTRGRWHPQRRLHV